MAPDMVPDLVPVAASAENAFDTLDPRQAHLVPAPPRELSKKERWLTDKRARPDVRLGDETLRKGLLAARRRADSDRLPPPGAKIVPRTTLFNVWTREALPLLPGESVETRFNRFLRDHYTNQVTEMDIALVDVLAQVAHRFRAARVEVVSGYRSPKYNLMLRKKGREVARTSQHVEGNAVDFRIRGVPTTVLLRYVRSLRRGGVGYYPRSQFVHADTGRIRFWKGT